MADLLNELSINARLNLTHEGSQSRLNPKFFLPTRVVFGLNPNLVSELIFPSSSLPKPKPVIPVKCFCFLVVGFLNT